MRLWKGVQQDQTLVCVPNTMPALADGVEAPLLLSLQPKAKASHAEMSMVASVKAD